MVPDPKRNISSLESIVVFVEGAILVLVLAYNASYTRGSMDTCARLPCRSTPPEEETCYVLVTSIVPRLIFAI